MAPMYVPIDSKLNRASLLHTPYQIKSKEKRMNANNWEQYRRQLRGFLQSRDSGMLLDADEEYEYRFGYSSERRAGFKLQNGQVVKKFLTIWELFDHSSAFNECIEKLAAKAVEIRQRVHFSKIITATLTAEELCNHAFDRLKRIGEGAELSPYHFGDYPTTPLSNDNSGQLKDERVLVLTDITSTGNLVRNLAENILKQGGQVVSVLSVAITKQDWIEQQNETGEPPLVSFSRGGARIHNLTDYGVAPLREEDYDADKLIPIDYASVLPETTSRYNQQYTPAFTINETFRHLEEAEAIDFSFYKFDDRYRTCALIISRLLETHKNEIWDKIREPVLSTAADDTLLLVTTYKREDILFKCFVEDRLSEEGVRTATGITLKRSVKDIPSRNLTLGARGRSIKGKEVVLVLATLSTTEKLRNLISLLVSCEVKKITVTCLLNEMGPYTTGFINAIERFTKRVKTNSSIDNTEGENFTDFAFHMIYSFLDIDDGDISKMHKEVDWLFSQFISRTRVPAFRRLTARMRGYFRSRQYAERAYENSSFQALQSAFTLEQYCNPTLLTDQELLSIPAQTQEAKIALITYNLALYRDFKPILQELCQTDRRRVFIHLYGLILSDIHYLQFTRILHRLKDKIIARLEELWQECFEYESNENNHEFQQREDRFLEKRIAAISYLFLGLSIVVHYDSRTSTNDISVEDLLFCCKMPEDWINHHAQFMLKYFSDERVFYFTSFLLHNLYPKMPQLSGRDRDTVDRLNSTVADFKRALTDYYQTIEGQDLEQAKSTIQLINYNLDTVLTETGKHEQREKHQTIRYLQREVLRPKEGHNPVFTNSSILLNELEDYFESYDSPNSERRFSADDKILSKIDDALNGTASLSIITEAVRQLFYFTPSERINRERYTSLASQDNSFAGDVEDVIELLTDMRSRRSFTYENHRNLKMLLRKIRDDFYDSKLREALQNYVVPLDELVEKTLLEVNERLNKEGFQNLLRIEYERLRGSMISQHESWRVLCDYYLLQETLRNLFYNIRYSFPPDLRSYLPDDAVRISFSETRFNIMPDNQNQDGILFELFVRGNPPSLEDLNLPEKTIANQLFKLQEFGVQWSLHQSNSFDAFTLKLIFLSRSRF